MTDPVTVTLAPSTGAGLVRRGETGHARADGSSRRTAVGGVPTESIYAEHLTGIARSFFAAARAEHLVSGIDLDVALCARRAVLELLTVAHQDLTGIGAVSGPVHPELVEVHPVAAFGQALRRHPRPPGALSPSDVAQARPLSAAGRAWQEISRHALLAHHAWTSGHDRGPADGDTVWAGIADLAALADTLTRLDTVLIAAADIEPGRDRVAVTLRAGLRSQLGVAARETARVAASGPLPESGPDRVAGRSVFDRTVLPVRAPRDLPIAQERLVRLLDVAQVVRPERFRQIVTMQARACMVLSTHLPGTPPGAAATPGPGATSEDEPSASRAYLGEELAAHARLLHRATERPGSIAGVEPGDGRPLRQAAEVLRVLVARPDVVAGDPELLTRVTAGLAAVTPALAAVADRGLARGAWQIPDHGESADTAPLWRTHRPEDPRPGAVAAIHRAAEHSGRLTEVSQTLRPHPVSLTARTCPNRISPARTTPDRTSPDQTASPHRPVTPVPETAERRTVPEVAATAFPASAGTWRPALTAVLTGTRPSQLTVRPALPSQPVVPVGRPQRR
jgi:hypothetical protein